MATTQQILAACRDRDSLRLIPELIWRIRYESADGRRRTIAIQAGSHKQAVRSLQWAVLGQHRRRTNAASLPSGLAPVRVVRCRSVRA